MEGISVAGGELALSCLPFLGQTTDVVAFQEAAVKFVKGCSKAASWNLLSASLGQIMIQPRVVTQLVLTRTQDRTGLLKAGADGLPFLSLGGDLDLVVSWKTAAPLMDGFTNKKFVEIKDADHMPWLTHPDVTRAHIVGWIEGVLKSKVYIEAQGSC